jgi:cobalt/nickel transport system permease protein
VNVLRAAPQAALASGGLLALSAASGVRGAWATLACCAVWAVLGELPFRRLLLRLAPAALGVSFLVLAAPFAPGRAAGLALQGFCVAAALLLSGAQVPWPVALGLLQALRAPRELIAFLAVLARHLAAVETEVLVRARAIALRGGFGGVRSLARSTQVLLARVFPSLLDRADRVAAALELRGFEGRLPAPPPWRLSRRDVPLLALGAVGAAAFALEALT